MGVEGMEQEWVGEDEREEERVSGCGEDGTGVGGEDKRGG